MQGSTKMERRYSVVCCYYFSTHVQELNVPPVPRMRHKFAKEVLFPISMTLNKGDSLRYSEILACDQTVREFGPSQAFHDSVLAALKYDEVQETSRSRVRAFLSKLMKDLGVFFTLYALSRSYSAPSSSLESTPELLCQSSPRKSS